MAKSTSLIAEAIDQVVSRGIQGILEAAGFKRAGMAFHRPTGDVHQVVDVQHSLRNEDNRGRFTVNLAVA